MATTPHTTTDLARDRRPRWGRSARLGGGSGRLILVSLVAGVVIALLIGAAAYGLASSQGDADPRFPAVMGAVMAASALPVGAALAWLFLVDRTTLRGCARGQLTPNRVGSHTAEAAQGCPAGRLLFLWHTSACRVDRHQSPPRLGPPVPGFDGKDEQ